MQSPLPILDPELLGAFAAFADTLNFTHAARAVGLSQPALFERVRRLAELLEVPLYERDGRALRLTPEGLRVAAYAREERARAAAFVRALRGEPTRETVSLAAGEGSFLYLLGPAIARFTASERASLRLLTLGARAACDAVLAGEAQLAVGVVDLVPEGLVAHDLVRTAQVLAMHRRHALAKRRSLRVADLAGERLILPPSGRSHRDFVGRAITAGGHDVAPPIEADGWPLMLQFAALGLGVAVVNGICALPRGVVARRIRDLGTVRYRLLTRRGATPTAPAQRLAQLVIELAPRERARERSLRPEAAS